MSIQYSRIKAASLLVSLGIFVTPFVALAQSTTEDIPRLADGHPDIQGTWDFRTITPFQRPESLADTEILTDAEAVAFQAEENVRRDRDNFTDTTTTGDYNQFWYDRGTELLDDGRTALIVDPPNGRIPALTEAAQEKKPAAKRRRQIGRGSRSKAAF